MLYNKLEKYRKEKNFTQADMAEKVDVSRQTIIAIEKGNYSPSLELAFKIAKVLKININDIFTYEK